MWNKMPLSSNDVCVDFVNERMNRTQQRSKEETCEKSRSWAQAGSDRFSLSRPSLIRPLILVPDDWNLFKNQSDDSSRSFQDVSSFSLCKGSFLFTPRPLLCSISPPSSFPLAPLPSIICFRKFTPICRHVRLLSLVRWEILCFHPQRTQSRSKFSAWFKRNDHIFVALY